MNKRFLTALLTGAFFIASASMFVSCKDYDDDISKNTAAIEALQKQLNDQKTSLEQQLQTAVAELNTALKNLDDKKANQDDVTKLTSRVAALETQIEACASKADLEELATKVAILTGDLENLNKLLGEETAARKAVEANLELQKKALEGLEKKFDELGIKVDDNTKAIAEIRAELNNFATKQEVEQLRADMMALTTDLSKRVDNIWNWINVLNVFVNKHLTSLMLKPSFYWEGLEGVEVPFANPAVFVEAGKYEFDYDVTTGGTAGHDKIHVTVDNHMTWGGKNSEDELVWMPDHRDFVSLTDDVAPATTKYVELSNGGILQYHVNPSTADIEGMKISFWENDATHFTRGNNGAIKATPKEETFTKDGKFNKLQGGILSIPFTVDNNAVMELFGAWIQTDPFNVNQYTNDPWWWDAFTSVYDLTQAHGAGYQYDDPTDPYGMGL